MSRNLSNTAKDPKQSVDSATNTTADFDDAPGTTGRYLKKEMVADRIERQFEAFTMHLQGMPLDQIAFEFGVTVNTIEKYLKVVKKSQASVAALTAVQHVQDEIFRNDMAMLQVNENLLNSGPREAPMHEANLIRLMELRCRILGIDHWNRAQMQKMQNNGPITVQIVWDDTPPKSDGEVPAQYVAHVRNPNAQPAFPMDTNPSTSPHAATAVTVSVPVPLPNRDAYIEGEFETAYDGSEED